MRAPRRGLPTPVASLAASFASSSAATAMEAPSPSPSPSAKATAAPTARPGPVAHVITNGPRDRRVIALTFDADMTTWMQTQLRSGAVASWYDARIVATLRAAQVPGTIFLTGLWTQAYADVVRSLAGDALFELENHSMDHAGWRSPCYGLPTISTDVARQAEVTGAAEVIRSTAGVDPTYFRFPGGCHTDADSALVASLGEQPLGWDVVSGDAFQADPDVIVRKVMARVRPGSIVVMHFIGAPNAPATAVALERLIPLLRAQGYEFATVSQLLAAPATSPGSGSSSPGPGLRSPGPGAASPS
jgi:peptidoglycan-N-acetylglucosamine deacetylase